jgi:hypothetical protein
MKHVNLLVVQQRSLPELEKGVLCEWLGEYITSKQAVLVR